jgi:hypothetical protein
MGIRRTTLEVIKTLLDNLVVGTDVEGNSLLLSATNELFDPQNNLAQLPKISVAPLPETIHVGLLGNTMDSTFRIGIFGYCYCNDSESAVLYAEDIIEAIQQKLCLEASALVMLQSTGNGFSIVEIGPCLNEQLDEECNLAYFSVPISIQFVQN